MKFLILLLLLPLFIMVMGCIVNTRLNQNVSPQPITQDLVNSNNTTTASTSLPVAGEKKVNEPQEVKTPRAPVDMPDQRLNWPVPFMSQAPFAVWDALHKEACEEAAMIIVAKYFNQEPLNPHIAEQSILDLVEWEKENNFKIDLTASEVKQILGSYFNLKAELILDPKIETVKNEIAAGNLVIMPAAGRQLNNPYFQTPGPIYHMLVIRGYDDKNFITNDPGTKRGGGFIYPQSKLLEAIHDWNHDLAVDGMTDEEMEMGQKVMIVVFK